MNKEKLDKRLTGQASSISPFMNLGDDTPSAQQKMLNPQEIVAISSRVYNMSLQQEKTEKPFKPQVYQRRGRGQRQNYDRYRSRNSIIDKVKILVKIDAVIIIEGMGTRKILVEIMAEVEAEISTETIAVTEVDQEKEGYHPEGTIVITITDKTQILDLDQGREVDLTQE